MLTNVRCHIGLALGDLAEHLDCGLRLDDRTIALVVGEQPAIAAPLVDLLPPAGHGLGIRRLADLLDDGDHLGQHAVDWANDRNICLDGLGDGCRINVDVDDLGIRAELGRAVDDAVIETRADRQNHIGVMHRQVGGVAAVHAEHADELAVAARIAAQAHQRIGHRQVEHLRQLGQLCRGLAQDHAATGVDDRTLGAQQQLRRFANLPRMPTYGRAVRTQLGLLRINVFEFFGRVGHVFRNIDDNRPWTPGLCEVERLLHHFGNFRRMLDHEAVLNDRPGDTDHVGFLEGVGADHGARHLTGNDHHRDRVHEGSGDTGDGICRARAGGHQHHAGLASRACIAIGHVGGSLLVANQDMFDGLFLEKRIVDMQNGTARVPVDVLNAFVTQGADDHFSAG